MCATERSRARTKERKKDTRRQRKSVCSGETADQRATERARKKEAGMKRSRRVRETPERTETLGKMTASANLKSEDVLFSLCQSHHELALSSLQPRAVRNHSDRIWRRKKRLSTRHTNTPCACAWLTDGFLVIFEDLLTDHVPLVKLLFARLQLGCGCPQCLFLGF